MCVCERVRERKRGGKKSEKERERQRERELRSSILFERFFSSLVLGSKCGEELRQSRHNSKHLKEKNHEFFFQTTI